MPLLALLVLFGLVASSKKASAAPAPPSPDALLQQLQTPMPDLHPGTRTPITTKLTPAGTIPSGWRVLAPSELTPTLRQTASQISALPPGLFYPFTLGIEKRKYGAMTLGGRTEILVPL